MASLKVLMLIVTACADAVVSPRDIEQYVSHYGVSSLLTIDGARYGILQEVDIYGDHLFAASSVFPPGTPATLE